MKRRFTIQGVIVTVEQYKAAPIQVLEELNVLEMRLVDLLILDSLTGVGPDWFADGLIHFTHKHLRRTIIFTNYNIVYVCMSKPSLHFFSNLRKW